MIDLFDGKLKGTDPARVHFAESVKGEALDYDFNLDVGLIRMRPGPRVAGLSSRPGLMGPPVAHESPHRRLFRGQRRHSLAHSGPPA